MKTNKQLFQEAIADAKSVRDAAIINAKQALEEALTPRLNNIFNSRLQEMEDEDNLDENYGDDNEVDLDEILSELDSTEDDEDDSDLDEAKEDDEDKKEDKKDKKYKKEEKPKKDKEEKEDDEEDDEKISDLSVEDFKSLITNIINDELGKSGEGLGSGEGFGDDLGSDDDGTGDMNSGIGDDDADGFGQPDRSKFDHNSPEDGEVDLDELLAELDELDGKKEDIDESKEEMKKVKKDLKEAIKTITTLRTQLHEVNLLNAKLLYVNKIFKSKNLNEGQKIKVIETLDKATTTKEAKLVYESLALSLGNQNQSKISKKQSIKESLGFASKPSGIASNKKNPIVEDQTVERFKKLANIK
jgi:hypothetical protein